MIAGMTGATMPMTIPAMPPITSAARCGSPRRFASAGHTETRPSRRAKAPGRPSYGLTRICSIEYIHAVESAFAVIAEPNRRAILSLLASSERSVNEIEQRLRMPQPSVSKHLRVLRDAGFVESRVDAQRRVYRIRPEPLKEVDDWLADFRHFWSAHVDALERHLDRMAKAPPKTRKRR